MNEYYRDENYRNYREDYVTMLIKFCSLDIFYMHILHKINQSADIY